MSDKRIWYPDDSCVPFYLNTNFIAASNIALFRFKMADNQYGVIRKVTLFRDAAGLLVKSNAKLIIREGQGGAVSINQSGKALHGTLMNAQEFEAATLVNVAGIAAVNFAPIPQDVVIQLEGGRLYEVDFLGAATNIFCAISGWTFLNTIAAV